MQPEHLTSALSSLQIGKFVEGLTSPALIFVIHSLHSVNNHFVTGFVWTGFVRTGYVFNGIGLHTQ